MYLLEYIWIDAKDQLRSKTKIVDTLELFNKPPIWTYDGSSTGQATGTHSDIILKPVNQFNDPFTHMYPGRLVLCETYTADDLPHGTNHRPKCAETAKQYASLLPLFGIEQEYLLMETDQSKPLGWYSRERPGCGAQDPYCGVGNDRAFGRPIALEHMEKCLEAGLKICGINAEVTLSQWEFQLGLLSALEISDQLWIARYILHRVCELHKCTVTFHPKPLVGWNGSGGHTNFSTEKMRLPGGLTEIKAACEKLALKHAEHIAVYGTDNEQRLTGHHETASIHAFSYAVADRGCSIRIPLLVSKNGCGYLEDRRPAANLNPYLVTEIIMRTTF